MTAASSWENESHRAFRANSYAIICSMEDEIVYRMVENAEIEFSVFISFSVVLLFHISCASHNE